MRNEGVALWYCIMVPATIVPYIGLLALIPLLVLMFMFVHDMQRTTRAILVETGGV